jgi:hypothetical protein
LKPSMHQNSQMPLSKGGSLRTSVDEKPWFQLPGYEIAVRVKRDILESSLIL